MPKDKARKEAEVQAARAALEEITEHQQSTGQSMGPEVALPQAPAQGEETDVDVVTVDQGQAKRQRVQGAGSASVARRQVAVQPTGQGAGQGDGQGAGQGTGQGSGQDTGQGTGRRQTVPSTDADSESDEGKQTKKVEVPDPADCNWGTTVRGVIPLAVISKTATSPGH